MSKPSRTYHPEQRQRALALADEIGAQRAADQLDIPAGTIRYWRSQAGEVQPPTGVDVGDWASRKEAAAESSWNAGMVALAQVHTLLDAGKMIDAQRGMLTAAIAFDKSAMLEQAAERARERQAALPADVAALVAEVIRRTLADLGVPLGDQGGPLREVLAHHLRAAEAGEQTGAAPEAAAARAELRAAFVQENAHRASPAPVEPRVSCAGRSGALRGDDP